ncbi:hypothetical protein LNTAR_19095 [Lentisphaera araneosa HTCC2155]|uniref:Uncharacterized protein n=1 Tax=Lentisphaera araneosa HTCC2155 TaxID=313628 RepID=A6DNX5_9BACT|nr:Mpv17/PMP22 family protein [Lentisphaera araneosa]EDM26784.1 hypothetical protein LNTAR_19095 [Lentisphaera araneosa HTCC2155]
MKALLREVKQALKLNLKPGLVLQAVAITLLLSYYNSSTVQQKLVALTDLKAENPYLFSGLSTALFAGALPYIILALSKRVVFNINLLLFMFLFWFWKGTEIELFYSFQADLFGSSSEVSVIIKKVLFDQFVFSTFYAVPCIVIIYQWKDVNFSFRHWKEKLNKGLFIVRIPTVMVSNWLVWIPACAVIYAMPDALQVPLSNIIGCFYVLMIEVLCKPSPSA